MVGITTEIRTRTPHYEQLNSRNLITSTNVFGIMLTSIFVYFYGVGWDWAHLVRLSLGRLLYLPRVVSEFGEIKWNENWQGKWKWLGENMSQCHFVHHKSHVSWPEIEPGRPGGKSATNHLNYGTTEWNTNQEHFEIYYRLRILIQNYDSNITIFWDMTPV
jgi:hypothetical protein